MKNYGLYISLVAGMVLAMVSVYSFKNAGKLDKMPSSFTKPEFKRLFEIAKISNLTKMEQMTYIRQMIGLGKDEIEGLR